MPSISLYFVRHGQRIDQVDASWVDTSPCRQDPPLTDLGKQQARHTGKMIRDLARKSSSLHYSRQCGIAVTRNDEPHRRTIQGITPPGSPTLSRYHITTSAAVSLARRPHRFAIITSPFLRCTQTAIEIAVGMRMAASDIKDTVTSTATGLQQVPSISEDAVVVCEEEQPDRDLVTISVESGIAGKSRINKEIRS